MFWTLGLLAACVRPPEVDRKAHDTGADDPAADGTAPADTASDGSGSGADDGLEGRYSGTIRFDLAELHTDQTEVCEGRIAFDLDLDSPVEPLLGDWQCSFQGPLADTGVAEGVVFGHLRDGNQVDGGYEMRDGTLSGQLGGVIADGAWSTSAEGTGEGRGMAFAYTVTLAVTR